MPWGANFTPNRAPVRLCRWTTGVERPSGVLTAPRPVGVLEHVEAGVRDNSAN